MGFYIGLLLWGIPTSIALHHILYCGDWVGVVRHPDGPGISYLDVNAHAARTIICRIPAARVFDVDVAVCSAYAGIDWFVCCHIGIGSSHHLRNRCFLLDARSIGNRRGDHLNIFTSLANILVDRFVCCRVVAYPVYDFRAGSVYA